MIDNNDIIIIYTDGACSGNPGPAGIGIVLKWYEHKKEISEAIGVATNNIAELTAILRALQVIKYKDKKVHLYTDSNYALGVLTLNWKTKANVELVKKIKEELALFQNLKILKTAGHSGIPENELADKLARQAILNQ